MPDYLEQFFDWDDPAYVAIFDDVPLWSALFGQMILAHLALRPAITLLDLACGAGFPLLELAERLGPSCRAVGLDTWLTALDRARQKSRLRQIHHAHLCGGSGAAIPVATGSFDVVVSNLGIGNMADLGATLAECRRVLKPGGTFALTSNLRGHMWQFYAVFARTLHDTGRDALLPALEAHINSRLTAEDIIARLEATGFTLRRVQEANFSMRYLDGSAMLHNSFIRQAFLDGWRGVLPPEDAPDFFPRLEHNLNALAAEQGELRVSIPALYLEATGNG